MHTGMLTSLMPRFGRGTGCQGYTEAKQVRSLIDRSFTVRGIPGHPHSDLIEGGKDFAEGLHGSGREQGSEITSWIVCWQIPKVEAGR